ncbi:delta-type opioid receptor-like [Acipenser ruthenus]|uniref:delta-type opioid receptor-like n=1 Tax=Acipenser ruthenus TaxID=7906 RepID=UPI00274106A1|nr:delta-type opioid receptor-like [Acipenser ruthenus]
MSRAHEGIQCKLWKTCKLDRAWLLGVALRSRLSLQFNMENLSNESAAVDQVAGSMLFNNFFCRNTTNMSVLDGNRCDRTDILNDSAPVVIAIIITALYSIVCVVGLVGNVLVMYVIIRYTKMKTATNIYILNLALADALATSTLPFQSVNYLMGTWPFGAVLCKIVMSIDYYNMFTSIFTLTIMSVDRYIAVCHPVKALDFRTPRNAKIINVCSWILSSAIGLPVMIMATTTNDSNGKYFLYEFIPFAGVTDCILKFPHPSWYWENLLKICVFIFAFIMPVLIITVCYGLMILRLKSVRMLSGSKEKDRNLRRITRMVLVVVAVFIVCWTPIHIYVIIQALVTVPNSLFQSVAWHICIALGYTNSCLNPVLYAFLDKNFKRCFQEFCIPTSSMIEQQNSIRTRNLNRDHNSSAQTVDRTNLQV